MIRTVSISLLTFSMLLVLSHAIFPHTHERTARVCYTVHHTDSFADLLKTTLAHNLGADHLKTFTNLCCCTSFHCQPDSEAISVQSSFLLQAYTQAEQEIIIISTALEKSQLFHCNTSLRAPPSAS